MRRILAVGGAIRCRAAGGLLLLISGVAGLTACHNPQTSGVEGVDRSLEVCSDGVFQAALAIARIRLEEAQGLLEQEPHPCGRAALLRALTLVAGQRMTEARQLLSQVAAGAANDPAGAVLAEELLATELASPGSDPQEAIAAAGRALTIDPRARRARLIRAVIEQGIDRSRAAQEVFALATSGTSLDDPQDLFLKQLASWLVDILSDGHPLPATASPVAHHVLSLLLEQRAGGRSGSSYRHHEEWLRTEAHLAYRDLASAQPDDVMREAGAARALLDFPGAIELLRSYLRVRPDQQDARVMLLEMLNRIGRYRDALAVEIPGPALCPHCVAAQAEAHLRLGDGQELPLLQDLRTRFPDQPEVLSLLGRSLVEHGRAAEAVPLLQQAAGGLSKDLPTLLALANALTRAGQSEAAARARQTYQDAQAVYEQETRQREANGAASAALSDARRALDAGDLARAADLLRAAEERQPGFHLLPLMRISLSLKKKEAPRVKDAEDLIDAVLARNPWLTGGRIGQ